MINVIPPGEVVPRPDIDEAAAVAENGTRHAWRNDGTEPCMIVGVAVGADRIPNA